MKQFVFVLLGLLLLAGCSGATPAATPTPDYADELMGAVYDPPRELQEFNLDSTTGAAFELSAYSGDVILLYFGYRSCPDFCPTTFAELRRVMNDLGDLAEKVQVVFVTIDPDRDTLDLLGLYTAAFNPDFIGLRGEGDTLQAVMDQFGVVAEKQVLGDDPQAYLMDHTASVFLIDPQGRLLSQYLYGTNYRDIVHDIQVLLGANPQA
ncbi:MAG: SCO family protein [Anaerolineae bacterium]|uniref:SCO family protein n=1 Tax=Candidatus Flexifilum breve TaxID=3140694 RepID=UPI001AC4909D|nr:SCO family protein [Chloroflexota bacterium]MBN8635334.1 SCO family protein [Anaerolineae bacterium]